MVNLGEAYRKLIGKTVRAARADKQLTNKRRCEPHGQMNNERTNDERMMKDKQSELRRQKKNKQRKDD